MSKSWECRIEVRVCGKLGMLVTPGARGSIHYTQEGRNLQRHPARSSHAREQIYTRNEKKDRKRCSQKEFRGLYD